MALDYEEHFSNTTIEPGIVQEIGYLNIANTGNDTHINLFSYLPFPTIFTPNDFDLSSNSSQNITVQISVPEFYQQGNISTYYSIVNTFGFDQNPWTISIPESLNYQINQTIFEFNTTNNEDGEISTKFKNNGNVDILIVFDNTNSTIFGLPVNRTVYKGETIEIKIPYHVPINTTEGNHTSDMIMFINGIPNTMSALFNVSDNKNPNVTKTVYKQEINYSESFELEFEVEDNIAVESVNARIEIPGGNVTNLTIEDGSKIFFYDTKKIGEYIIYLGVRDVSGNEITHSIIFNVLPVKALQLVDQINFGKIKVQEFVYTKNLGYLSKQAELAFKLSDINVLNDTKISINDFPLEGKETILDTLDGNLELRIRSSVPNIQSFTITVTPDQSLDAEQEDIVVFFEFIEYDPLMDFDTILTGHSTHCEANDTGVLSTSTYNCLTSYPATIDFDTLTLAVSPVVWDKLQEDHDDDIIERDGIIFRQTMITWIFVILLIIVGIYLGYSKYYVTRRSW